MKMTDEPVSFIDNGATQLGRRSTSAPHRDAAVSVNISRPVYSQQTFDKTFKEHDNSEQEKKNQPFVKKFGTAIKTRARKCLPASCSSFLLGLFPFVSILSKYNWRHDAIRDLIAGATVSFLHVPQAMAYGQLATLRPIHGLYVAFFPGLIYFLMGTSRQLSMGVFAIVSLMIAKVLDAEIATNSYGLSPAVERQLITDLTDNSTLFANFTDATNMTSAVIDPDAEELRVRLEIATSYNLIIGIFQMVLGIIGAGFVTDYLNEPFISGYTTACACHVFTSQLWLAFGIKSVRHSGALKLVLTLKDFFIRLPQTHLISFGIFISALIVLTIWKEVLEPRVKRKFTIPIPVELILIIIVDGISYALGLKQNYNVPIVGQIPSEFPIPKPPIHFRWNYLVDCIPIVLVSFSVCISLSKTLAKKYRYQIQPNQEFLAVGTANIFGSFFSCYTASSAMSRTMVQSNVGGQTQVATLISGSIILIVIMVLGSFLEPLPTSILSAVVIVNLKGMFLQFWDIPRFWRICTLDAGVWIVTFIATFMIDVDVGLYIGVFFVIVTIIIQTAQSRFSVQWQVPSSELFTSISGAKKLSSAVPAFVLRWSSPIYFASVEKLADAIQQGIQQPPSSPDHETKLVTTVILDISGVLFIDTAGVDFFKKTVPELAKIKVDLLLAGCPKHVQDALSTESTLTDFLAINTFVSTIDAVTAIQSGQFQPWRKAGEKKPVEAKPVENSAATEALLSNQEESSKV